MLHLLVSLELTMYFMPVNSVGTATIIALYTTFIVQKKPCADLCMRYGCKGAVTVIHVYIENVSHLYIIVVSLENMWNAMFTLWQFFVIYLDKHVKLDFIGTPFMHLVGQLSKCDYNMTFYMVLYETNVKLIAIVLTHFVCLYIIWKFNITVLTFSVWYVKTICEPLWI